MIQKYLESNDKIFLNKLLDKLVDNCLILIIDQFGNYVVQSILLVGKNFYGNKIAEKINCNIIYYSKHKYSSNVVEKCFDYCSGKTREKLIKIIMKKENLCDLLFDEHGNYIVQKVLSISEKEIQKQILKIIVENFGKLRKVGFGERIINKINIGYKNYVDEFLKNDEQKRLNINKLENDKNNNNVNNKNNNDYSNKNNIED